MPGSVRSCAEMLRLNGRSDAKARAELAEALSRLAAEARDVDSRVSRHLEREAAAWLGPSDQAGFNAGNERIGRTYFDEADARIRAEPKDGALVEGLFLEKAIATFRTLSRSYRVENGIDDLIDELRSRARGEPGNGAGVDEADRVRPGWLTTATDYRTELQRVMATRYKNTMYLEDRVMNVCAPLESFDIARRNRPKNTVDFIDCIKASIDYAGLPFRDLIVERPADWARKVTTARKHLAHHGKQFRADGTVGERLLAEQLYWLFVHCILRVAQAPATAFDRMSRHAETLWLIDQSRERLMEP